MAFFYKFTIGDIWREMISRSCIITFENTSKKNEQILKQWNYNTTYLFSILSSYVKLKTRNINKYSPFTTNNSKKIILFTYTNHKHEYFISRPKSSSIQNTSTLNDCRTPNEILLNIFKLRMNCLEIEWLMHYLLPSKINP